MSGEFLCQEQNLPCRGWGPSPGHPRLAPWWLSLPGFSLPSGVEKHLLWVAFSLPAAGSVWRPQIWQKDGQGAATPYLSSRDSLLPAPVVSLPVSSPTLCTEAFPPPCVTFLRGWRPNHPGQ